MRKGEKAMKALYQIYNSCAIRRFLFDGYINMLFEKDLRVYEKKLFNYISELKEILADIDRYNDMAAVFRGLRSKEQIDGAKIKLNHALKSDIFREWILKVLENLPESLTKEKNREYFRDIQADLALIESKSKNAIERAEKKILEVRKSLEYQIKESGILTGETDQVTDKPEAKQEQKTVETTEKGNTAIYKVPQILNRLRSNRNIKLNSDETNYLIKRKDSVSRWINKNYKLSYSRAKYRMEQENYTWHDIQENIFERSKINPIIWDLIDRSFARWLNRQGLEINQKKGRLVQIKKTAKSNKKINRNQ